MVALIALGGTTAFLFSRTDTKTNVFSFADNIAGYLEEPSWDPSNGENLVPRVKIEKDPQITNTSNNGLYEYAAIRLTFVDGAGFSLDNTDLVKLLNLIDIEWGGNWTLISGTITENASGVVTAVTQPLIYSFDEILPPGVTTDPIFYSVTVKSSITPEELEWLRGRFEHDEDCYIFGTHDTSICTIAYRHHEKCAIAGQGDKTTVPAAGKAANGTYCDCSAATVHSSACPSLIGAIKPDCGHSMIPGSGLNGFKIIVDGGIVQADAFDTLDDAKPALISLFA